MKAVRLNIADRPALELRDEPRPTLGRRDVLVRVHAASLNYRDQAVLDGRYGSPTQAVVPLSDGAGEVVEVGEDVTRTRVGDRVVANCLQHWIGGPYLPEYQSSSVGFTIDGWPSTSCCTRTPSCACRIICRTWRALRSPALPSPPGQR